MCFAWSCMFVTWHDVVCLLLDMELNVFYLAWCCMFLTGLVVVRLFLDLADITWLCYNWGDRVVLRGAECRNGDTAVWEAKVHIVLVYVMKKHQASRHRSIYIHIGRTSVEAELDVFSLSTLELRYLHFDIQLLWEQHGLHIYIYYCKWSTHEGPVGSFSRINS